jgi:uncharacterized phiE125 gp8 family phage protein
LTVASDAVRSATGRQFDRIETRVILDGTGSASLLLPNPPVQEVDEVITLDSQGDETEVDATDYRLDPDPGILRRIDGNCWPRGFRNIEVTLLAGYLLPEMEEDSGAEVPDLPKDIQGVVLTRASRNYDEIAAAAASGGAGELQSVTMGVYSETFAASGDSSTMVQDRSGWTAEEQAVLERWRLIRVG